jgi:hypothetical protein
MILVNVDNDTCRLWCVGQRVGKHHFTRNRDTHDFHNVLKMILVNVDEGGWWVSNPVGNLCLKNFVSHHVSNVFSKCFFLDVRTEV